ncbi:MAG: cytochrome C oxidase subunit I [Cyclobacteriaceae bacterium]|nr:cytochrome C oxidase subunit I [Cyclobacteriaceae bacterium]
MISGNIQKTTSHQIVLPFYLYAALAFLSACAMLYLFTDSFHFHHFNPKTLAVVHTMALGWATMMILGASYQLVPVLIEGKLYSESLAYLSFVSAAIGIPILVYGFYVFDMGWPLRTGGILVNVAVLLYLINLGKSLLDSQSKNIHAIIVFTAMLWLLATTLLGLLLVYNFGTKILSRDSLSYLSIHAHIGIAGWFLQLVIGVGSRLIPMFLISKYTNQKLLWQVYALINLALVLFIMFDLLSLDSSLFYVPLGMVLLAMGQFGSFVYKAYQQRIRKKVDEAMQLSLLSVVMIALPLVVLLVFILVVNFFTPMGNLANVYGFLIFFGWLTAIILGMTFKTLPFIVWNKVYHKQATDQVTPNPKDLFNEGIFKISALSYLLGFVIFSIGLMARTDILLQTGALLLLCTAILYNYNVFKILLHKTKK